MDTKIRLRRPFTGDPEKALAWAREKLQRLGFTVADGEGLKARKARTLSAPKDHLCLASPIEVWASEGEIGVATDLRTGRSYYLRLWLMFAAFNVWFFGVMTGLQDAVSIPHRVGAISLPFIVLLCAMVPIARGRTITACRIFLEEVAGAGGDPTAEPGKPPLTAGGRVLVASGVALAFLFVPWMVWLLVNAGSMMDRPSKGFWHVGGAGAVFGVGTMLWALALLLRQWNPAVVLERVDEDRGAE